MGPYADYRALTPISDTSERMLSEGAGDKWQAPMGRCSGDQGWGPLNFLEVRL